MKKVLAKTCIIVMLAALVFLAAFICVHQTNIAFAEDTVKVVKASAGNLASNAYAGKSAVKIYYGDNAFYIPESYFVQVKKQLGPSGYYSVSYCGEEFYIESGFDSETISVSENENLSPDVRLTLKSDVNLMINNKSITNDYTIKLLGYSEDGNEIFASATLNGDTIYGFIPKSYLEAFNVPYQKRAQAKREAILSAKTTPEISDGNISPNTSLALRIVLIIGITVPAVIIVILLFKPSKDDRRRSKRAVRRERGGDIDYDESRSYRHSNDRYDDYDRRPYDRREGYDRSYDRNDRDRDYDRDRSYDRGYDPDDRYYDDRDRGPRRPDGRDYRN